MVRTEESQGVQVMAGEHELPLTRSRWQRADVMRGGSPLVWMLPSDHVGERRLPEAPPVAPERSWAGWACRRPRSALEVAMVG
jgi:hypothetical protein